MEDKAASVGETAVKVKLELEDKFFDPAVAVFDDPAKSDAPVVVLDEGKDRPVLLTDLVV